MKKLSCLLMLLGGLCSVAFGYGRSGDLADPTFLNAGDSAIAISVTISSSAAVQVFNTTTTAKIDREIMLQNNSDNYEIVCGTHSAISATSGSRFFIPAKTSLTTNGHYNIWCVLESGGSASEVLGVIEYDSKD